MDLDTINLQIKEFVKKIQDYFNYLESAKLGFNLLGVEEGKNQLYKLLKEMNYNISSDLYRVLYKINTIYPNFDIKSILKSNIYNILDKNMMLRLVKLLNNRFMYASIHDLSKLDKLKSDDLSNKIIEKLLFNVNFINYLNQVKQILDKEYNLNLNMLQKYNLKRKIDTILEQLYSNVNKNVYPTKFDLLKEFSEDPLIFTSDDFNKIKDIYSIEVKNIVSPSVTPSTILDTSTKGLSFKFPEYAKKINQSSTPSPSLSTFSPSLSTRNPQKISFKFSDIIPNKESSSVDKERKFTKEDYDVASYLEELTNRIREYDEEKEISDILINLKK